MNSISTLHLLGQSIWYDNIQRRMLDNGDLARMISRGEIRGVTSNPTIFNNAIAKSSDYDAALARLSQQGKSTEEIFFSLAVDDIRAAADLLFPLYQQTCGGDGYVSLEVSPFLANDTDGTVAQANQLWQWVNRPNLMIKIPATRAGIPAIAKSIESGINVNVTLIFSLARYAEVMDAYLCGLENRAQSGSSLSTIASVASFFVSRVDTKIDARLQALAGGETPDAVKAGRLLGKAAIANAKMAYALFLEVFSGDRFSRLRQKGARAQRPLWASTGTKNPAYRDVVYIEELIGPDTVNTVPPQTLDAFRDHGQARLSIQENLQAAQLALKELEILQISMEEVTAELEEEGVKSFSDAFTSLLKTIESRRSGT